MSSTLKRRPKSKPNPDSNSLLFLNSLKEPPRDLFPSKNDLTKLIAVLIVACFVSMSCNFIVSRFINHRPVPFCDTHADSLDSISSSCEPCPSNGKCHEGKLECLRGYRKNGKLCIEDGVINEAVKKLSEWLESHLCEANAKFLCGGSGIVWVKEDDIWNDQELATNIGSDNTSFVYAKRRALETVGGLFQARENSLGVKELKCSDFQAENYKPFTCRIRLWAAKHAFVVLPVCLLLLGCAWLLWKLHRRLYLSNRAEDLYNQVCEILEENALMSKRISGQCESWVVASRLRDHLLLPRERKDPLLWRKVEELVQEDSRIDRYPRLVKGEGMVVWEWQVEGSLSSSREKRPASKLNSQVPIEVHSGQLNHKMKEEPKPKPAVS